MHLVWRPDALRSWVPSRPGSATCLLWCDPDQGAALLCASVSPVVQRSYQTLFQPMFFCLTEPQCTHQGEGSFTGPFTEGNMRKGTGGPRLQITLRPTDPALTVWLATRKEGCGGQWPAKPSLFGLFTCPSSPLFCGLQPYPS